jgi:PHD/YefM family antitoxin component YafN of YafNO toxin-antitoxin module
MATITIPKKVTRGTELVVIPRQEYERLLTARLIPEFRPAAAERRDLARARKNRARGRFLTLDELKRKLGFAG